MPKPKLIPDDLHPKVLERAGKGQSNEVIAAWLSKALGKAVDARRVRELLERVRKERAPAAQAVIADKVGKTVGSDLEALQVMLDELDTLKQRLDTAGDLRGVIAAVREKHALVKTRLELSGSGSNQQSLEQLILTADRKLREAAGKA